MLQSKLFCLVNAFCELCIYSLMNMKQNAWCLIYFYCSAGLKADRAEFPDIENALKNAVNQRNLQQHPTWLNKCIQLYETYLVRHGIMVVGPSGGGKSSILECLAAALTELGTKHVIWRMNPKAITAPQMFGRYAFHFHICN